MCGVSAIIYKSERTVAESEIEAMNNKIIHRGPDDSGGFINNNLAFGFRRLSILDLSFHGHQPMIDQEGNAIIFNGEIFNYVEIRDSLKSEGESFTTETDTEVILAAYRKWGAECFKRFNGMWGILIYDPSLEKVFICRDRFGIKPLNYWETEDEIVFCSEIKQLMALPQFVPKLNKDSAARFLVKRQLNTSTNTFFEGVKELAPGHIMAYDLQSHKKSIEAYYLVESIKQNTNITYKDAAEEFYGLFENAVKIRLRSDMPIGSCLSGGLDSSSIVTMANKLSAENLSATTISSCWSDARYDEQEYIDEVINSTNFHSVKIFPDINELASLNRLSDIVYHQDQPIKSASHFAEYSVFKAAKENHLTVMLDGQGSDEFLAGYIPFRFYNTSLIRQGQFIQLFNELAKQRKNHYSLSDIILHNTIHFLRTMGIQPPSRNNLDSSFFKSEIIDRIIDRPQDRINFSTYRDNSVNEIKYTSIPYQLHSEDRNSMMHSIESRLPFLDFDLADFMFALPDKYKMGGGITKKILRDSLGSILPTKIVNRHSKKGFEAPEEPFMMKNSNWIRSVLERAVEQNSDLLNSTLLKQFDSVVTGSGKYNNVYFRILSFQLWAERFTILN